MIVLDASAVIEWLLQTASGRQIERRILSRQEVAQVLRRLEGKGTIILSRADEALQDLSDLRINRYPHHPLLPRIWQLRHNLSASDACICNFGRNPKRFDNNS